MKTAFKRWTGRTRENGRLSYAISTLFSVSIGERKVLMITARLENNESF